MKNIMKNIREEDEKKNNISNNIIANNNFMCRPLFYGT